MNQWMKVKTKPKAGYLFAKSVFSRRFMQMQEMQMSPFRCDAIVDCPFFLFFSLFCLCLYPSYDTSPLAFFPYSESPSERERSDDKGKGGERIGARDRCPYHHWMATTDWISYRMKLTHSHRASETKKSHLVDSLLSLRREGKGDRVWIKRRVVNCEKWSHVGVWGCCVQHAC